MLCRTAITTVLAIFCGQVGIGADSESGTPFIDAGTASVLVDGNRLVIALPGGLGGDDWRLVAWADAGPIGWFDFDPIHRDFRRVVAQEVAPPKSVHAWLVARDALTPALDTWPESVPLLATMDSVAPGGGGGWLRAHAAARLAAGQSWWVRTQRQPVARLTIVFAETGLAYGRITALAVDAEALVAPGVALECWINPNPGRIRSAVCRAAGGDTVWIAAPFGLVALGQRVVFFRHGEAVGRGTLVRADDRFGFVMRSPATQAGAVRVGDEAVVEPLSVAAAQIGTVFAESEDKPLVDVGEIDGLVSGARGELWRNGESMGGVTVTRLQKRYSAISWGGAQPRPGDRVAFGETPDVAAMAVVEAVADGSVFAARSGLVGRIGAIRVVRDEAGVVGAVVVVSADNERIIGFAIEAAMRRPLQMGDRITGR